MQNEKVSKTVMRFVDNDDDYVYIGHYCHNGERYYAGNVYNFDEAMDLSRVPEEEIRDLFVDHQNYYEDYDCEIVRITREVTVEELQTDDTTIKELRQRQALSKLTERDIKILGLGSVATYIKTKYHNT